MSLAPPRSPASPLIADPAPSGLLPGEAATKERPSDDFVTPLWAGEGMVRGFSVAARSGPPDRELCPMVETCEPVAADNEVLKRRQTKLDRLYVAVDKAIKDLAHHLGMAA